MKYILLFIFITLISIITNYFALEAYDSSKEFRSKHKDSYKYLKIHMYVLLVTILGLIILLLGRSKSLIELDIAAREYSSKVNSMDS